MATIESDAGPDHHRMFVSPRSPHCSQSLPTTNLRQLSQPPRQPSRARIPTAIHTDPN